MDKYEIVFAGNGGQGLIVAGILAGHAATRQGLYAAQTQSYGISARGGYCRAEVVLSDNEIIYPQTVAPDIVIALSEKALDRFSGQLKDDARLIYDSDCIKCDCGDPHVIGYGLTSLTQNCCGSLQSLNICALGVLLACKEIVPVPVMQDTIVDFFKGKNKEKNLEIFRKGFDLVRHSN
jgi:2-oxoglutarate ferredoxin oxidoreductase subunit gamma